jgi:hypothetical protein
LRIEFRYASTSTTSLSIQDLSEEKGFTDSYESVKRFVRKLRASQPERGWRLECQPGEELQLDFGLGAPIDEG